MKIFEYLYVKIGGNEPEDRSSRLSSHLWDLVFFVTWYFLASCAILYSIMAGLNERRTPTK
jgi:hypothetical protein